jgi:probable rRNA maturation factor
MAVISNRQERIPLNVQFLHPFVRSLRSLLRLGPQRFDITIVDDGEIERLNRAFRRKSRPTDVLSFPWHDEAEEEAESMPARKEWSGFLGDIVISAETAQRRSIAAGISLRTEMQQLVLHGALHLLGYDHETDEGEMQRLEASLARRLGIGNQKAVGSRQKVESSRSRMAGRR